MRPFFCAMLSVGALVLAARDGQAAPEAATSAPEAAPAGADVSCASDGETNPSTARRVAATGVALTAGLIVNGSGHWVVGSHCTARRLLVAEAVGLVGLGIGIPTLNFTGAAHALAGPAILMTLGGFSIVIAAIGADIYGVVGAARYAGEPLRLRPKWETELGVTRVYNPSFNFGWLLTQRAKVNAGRASVVGGLDAALDGTHSRYRLGMGLRIAGALPEVEATDGTYIDLESTIGEQRFTGMGFVTDSAEMQATGRVDLAQFGPTLRGSFAEVTMGVAYLRTSYHLEETTVDADYESMLLGRIGFGVYLGRMDRRGGEAMLYYDHRREDYAAGLKLPGYSNGIVGHAGLAGRYFVSKQFGVGVLLEAGSSYVANLSLLFRAGAQP